MMNRKTYQKKLTPTCEKRRIAKKKTKKKKGKKKSFIEYGSELSDMERPVFCSTLAFLAHEINAASYRLHYKMNKKCTPKKK